MERLATGYGLIEGPLWMPERGLVFSDVLNGGVFCLGLDGQVRTLFEHRRGVGGIALHAAGGLLVSGRNIAYKSFAGGPTVTLLDRDPEAGNVGYNDLTTDAAGRVYAGSLGTSPVFENAGEPAPGDLWLIDLDGTSRTVAQEIWLTNGLGFAPDGKTLYHSDSRVQIVWCYAVAETGDLGPKQVFARTTLGVPDGLVVAMDGSVWVALAGGGHGVAVFDTAGVQRDFLETPEPMCTSVCFGGADLTDLYVVTGSDGADRPNAGSVYRHPAGIAGVPVAPARVKLP